VLIDATNNDYADNAEGDAIVYEGAKPIYQCFGVPQNLALARSGHGKHRSRPDAGAGMETMTAWADPRHPCGGRRRFDQRKHPEH